MADARKQFTGTAAHRTSFKTAFGEQHFGVGKEKRFSCSPEEQEFSPVLTTSSCFVVTVQ